MARFVNILHPLLAGLILRTLPNSAWLQFKMLNIPDYSRPECTNLLALNNYLFRQMPVRQWISPVRNIFCLILNINE